MSKEKCQNQDDISLIRTSESVLYQMRPAVPSRSTQSGSGVRVSLSRCLSPENLYLERLRIEDGTFYLTSIWSRTELGILPLQAPARLSV